MKKQNFFIVILILAIPGFIFAATLSSVKINLSNNTEFSDTDATIYFRLVNDLNGTDEIRIFLSSDFNLNPAAPSAIFFSDLAFDGGVSPSCLTASYTEQQIKPFATGPVEWGAYGFNLPAIDGSSTSFPGGASFVQGVAFQYFVPNGITIPANTCFRVKIGSNAVYDPGPGIVGSVIQNGSNDDDDFVSVQIVDGSVGGWGTLLDFKNKVVDIL